MPFFNTPTAPIYTFNSGVGFSTVSVTVERVGGASPRTYDIPTPTRTNTAPQIMIDVLTQYVSDESGTVLSSGFTWGTSNRAILLYSVSMETDLGDDIQVNFSSGEQRNIYGWREGSGFNPVFAEDGTPTTSFRNCAGVWSPRVLTFSEQRTNRSTIASTSGLSIATPNVVQWGINIEYTTNTHPYVQAANVFQYRALDTAFSVPANRGAFDRYNTYESMIIGVRSDSQGLANVYDTTAPASSLVTDDFDLDLKYIMAINEGLDDLFTGLSDQSAGRLWNVEFSGRIIP